MTTVPTERQGFIYVATGEKYVQEAIVAANSLQRHMPTAHITLVTDATVPLQDTPFQGLIKLPKPTYTFADKILGMQQTPYEHTVMLDVDTWICDDISELFDLLDRFDFAATVRLRQVRFEHQALQDLHTTPASFPSFNSGVVCFKKSSAMDALLADWLAHYQQATKLLANLGFQPNTSIEPSLQKALYYSDLRLTTLNPNYNCFLESIGGSLDQKVKIIHGRHPNIDKVARRLNVTSGRRIFLMGNRRALPTIFDDKNSNLLGNLIRLIFGHRLRTWLYLWRESLKQKKNSG